MMGNKQLLIDANVGWVDEDSGLFELNMNDTWAWALAWFEEVPDEKIDEVARLFKCWGCAGLDYWVSEQNDGMRSEFHDINRAVDFVRFEEELKKAIPDSSERAYKQFKNTATKKTCEPHGKWPCRKCGTKHYPDCQCSFCKVTWRNK